MRDYEHVLLPCGICGKKIDRLFIGLPDATRSLPMELIEFCEYPVHQDCLAHWEHRLTFSKAYFEDSNKRWQDQVFRRHILAKSDTWMLVTGPRGPHITEDTKRDMVEVTLQLAGLQNDTINPVSVSVTLKEWPFRLYCLWDHWTRYIRSGYRTHYIHEILCTIDPIVAEIRTIASTTEALRDLLDRQN